MMHLLPRYSIAVLVLCLGCSRISSHDAPPEQTPHRESVGGLHDSKSESASTSWRLPELTSGIYSMQTGDKPCPEEGNDVTYLDPFEVIHDFAKDYQVTMINESHFKPVHRVFVQDLTKRLLDDGYRYFGSELFGVGQTSWLNSTLKERGSLVRGLTLHHYWSDPIFSQVVETLVAEEIELFSYEQAISPLPDNVDSIVAYRESGQAKNIHEFILERPDGKFIIHAGYHHIKEVDSRTGISWMAEIFTSLSGIDPLTISQTECFLESGISGNYLGYGLLADGNGVPISRDGYDLIIMAPLGEYEHGRPVWLQDALGRKPVDLPDHFAFEEHTLVVATNLEKPEDAPYEDLIYLAPKSDKRLALRPGSYRVTALGKGYKVITEQDIVVE
ncbi:MAG: hypothetical protein ACSHX3_13920 [Litorimonas sp.]